MTHLEYLKIRRTKKQVRADGTPYAVPIFVSKTRKYGKVTSEQPISVKTSILVTGAHDSGKTRWITRLHENGVAIWGAKHKAEPLYLDALSPIAAWCDLPAIGNWWNAQQAELPQDEQTPWKSLKQHARTEALPDYCRENKAVLFIDDAHKLAGRKLQLARQCAMACRLSVVSASEEQRIPPNLRSVLMRRKPQIFRLDSEVAYDATHIIMWLLLVTCLLIGWWEAALVLGGFKALGTGRRAARAD